MVLVVVYMNLPADMHNEQIDAYILRIEEKLTQLESGNYVDATTNRTKLVSRYMAYFLEQSIFNFFIGGLSIVALNGVATHNTYVDIILQVGVIGTIALMVWIIMQIVQTIHEKDTHNGKLRLILKFICLIAATNLSLNHGSTWSLWLYFLTLI